MTKILAALFCVAAIVAPAPQQAPRELFERARMLEESNNKLADAIVLYAQVASQAVDRQLAATAQLRIGLLHERLGQPAAAERAFRLVMTRFGDQPAAVRQAEARLGGHGRHSPKDSRPGTRPLLTGGSGNENAVSSVSSDGRFVSFTDWDTGDLAVKDMETGASRRLTAKGSWASSPEFAEFSVISPDGSQIVYAWWLDGGVELRLIARGGGAPRVVYRNAETTGIQPFDFSPGGREIVAVFGRADRTHQLVVIPAAGGSPRVLKTLDWRAPWKMAFSPDGRYIAYDLPPTAEAPERDLFLLAADGSREVPLVRHPAHDVLLGWFPRGDRILFASDRNGTNGAWAVDLEDGRPQGEPRLLKPGLGHVLPIDFTNSGDYVYLLRTGLRQVQTARLEPAAGGLIDPLTPLRGRADEGRLSAVWSPDGSRLAYLVQSSLVRGGEGGNLLAIQSMETGQVRTVPLNVSYANRIRWQPDGRGVVVGGTDLKGRRGVFRVDISSGSLEPMVSRRAGRFAMTPDGMTLFYEPRGEDGGHVVARDLRTGEERNVLPCGGSCGLALSPDGKWLAVKVNLPTAEGRSRFPSIQIVPVAGGERRTVLTLPDADVSEWREMAWSADGRYLFFTKSHSELWQIAVSGGTPTRLVAGLTYINSISVHPDGRRIAVSSGSAKYEAWVMENLASADAATSASRR